MADTFKHRLDNWFSDPTIFVIVVTCLTVIVGIVLAEVQPHVGYLVLLIAVGIILAVFTIAVLMIAAPLKRQMAHTLTAISNLVDPSSIPWLLDTPQLIAFEKAVDADEIWLLSSDLLDDSEGGPFEAVVTHKLKSGTSYVYFVPDLPEIRARVQILGTAHKHNSHLRFIYLSDKFFFLVPKLDIAIYNPLSHDSLRRSGYMGIPDTMGTNHYHARVSFDFVDRLVGVLLKSYHEQTSSAGPNSA